MQKASRKNLNISIHVIKIKQHESAIVFFLHAQKENISKHVIINIYKNAKNIKTFDKS